LVESIIPNAGNDAQAGSVLATGKRKCSIARVRIIPGDGKFLVNEKPARDHFLREAQVKKAISPLKVISREGRYDVFARVSGGGIAGQADAVRLGLARALEKADPTFRPMLKSAGFLSRDARVKESKKYGRKRARKKFQFSKR
jgi:small subunit ribosomal protein S9